MRSLLIFWRLFFKSPKSSSLKSLYNLFLICFQSLPNFNKHLVFWWFLFSRNLKTVFWTVYSNSHQAVLWKTTSHILFQIFTPSLFMGSILEKIEKFLNLLLIPIHVKLSVRKLLPTMISGFLLHLFHVFYSEEKWEVCQSFGDFFSRA